VGACVVSLGEEEGGEGEGEGGDEGESGEEEGEDGGMLVVHFRCVEMDQKIGRVGEDGGRSLAKVVMHVDFRLGRYEAESRAVHARLLFAAHYGIDAFGRVRENLPETLPTRFPHSLKYFEEPRML